jgi:hypothetical protein
MEDVDIFGSGKMFMFSGVRPASALSFLGGAANHRERMSREPRKFARRFRTPNLLNCKASKWQPEPEAKQRITGR